MWHLFLRSVATPAWVPRGRDHLRPGPHCFLAYRTWCVGPPLPVPWGPSHQPQSQVAQVWVVAAFTLESAGRLIPAFCLELHVQPRLQDSRPCWRWVQPPSPASVAASPPLGHLSRLQAPWRVSTQCLPSKGLSCSLHPMMHASYFSQSRAVQ